MSSVTNYLEFYQDGKKVQNLEFPDTEIGQSSTVKLEIKNPNDWPIMVVKPLVDDRDITFSKIPDVIEALDSVTIEATLKPTPGRGPLKAELQIKILF